MLPRSKAELKRQCNQCVKAVAGLLGNTPAVCRSSYVHPAVFDLHESGALADLPGPDARGSSQP